MLFVVMDGMLFAPAVRVELFFYFPCIIRTMGIRAGSWVGEDTKLYWLGDIIDVVTA